jgi:hypothetical protein
VPLLLDAAGGTGRSDVPRKKATLTYFVKQWDAEEPALSLTLGVVAFTAVKAPKLFNLDLEKAAAERDT